MENMKNYLEDKLRVPETRIRTLKDAEATRDAIISALQDLAVDPAIRPGDPILIFYAGHGTQQRKPDAPPTRPGDPEPKKPDDQHPKPDDRFVESILPYDALAEREKGTISLIPDVVMADLVGHIRTKKGPDIVRSFIH